MRKKVKSEIVTRAEFARMAGVSEAAITKAAGRKLAPAVAEHGINVQHPAAQAYLAQQIPREDVAEGIDSRYDDAVALCRELGRVSVRALEMNLKISRSRCQRLAAVIEAAGVMNVEAPSPDVAQVAEPIAEPVKNRAKPAPKARAVVPPRPSAPPPPAFAVDHGLDDAPEDGITPPDDITSLAHLTLQQLVDRFGTASRFEKWLSAVQKIEAIHEKRLSNAETQGGLISKKLVKSAVLDVIDGVFTRLLTDGCQTVATRAHALALAGGDVGEIRDMIEDTMQSFIKPAKRQMGAACLS
jgi:hypothetical protein